MALRRFQVVKVSGFKVSGCQGFRFQGFRFSVGAAHSIPINLVDCC